MIERAVYRWDDWDCPIGHVQFDPFESPWKPLAPETVAAPAHAAPADENRAAPPTRHDPDSISDLRAAVDTHERTIIEHHLTKHRYNQRTTAKALGLTYDQLRHCLKKHGLGEKAGA